MTKRRNDASAGGWIKILKRDKKRPLVLLAIVTAGAVCLLWVLLPKASASTQTGYRETVVARGELVVGVTESASVDIGTVEQTFELDMSTLQRASTDNLGNSNSSYSGSGGNSFSGNMGGSMGAGGGAGAMGGTGGMSMGSFGGMTGGTGTAGVSSGGSSQNMFGQLFDMGGSNTSSAGEMDALEVSQVFVSVGQRVQEGDALYALTEETVNRLREELEDNVEKAKADLEAVYADQELSRASAQYTYDSSIAYGEYADTEYSSTLKSLEDAVAEKTESLAEAKELLTKYETQLAEACTDYEMAAQVLANCTWSVENTDKWADTGSYVYYYDLMLEAQTTADSLLQKKEQLEERVSQAKENVSSCETALLQAKRSLASGTLNAQETLELRRLAYQSAQETYDIAQAYLEDDAVAQEEIYAEAQEKWEDFGNHVDGTQVRSRYNGVITEVNLAAGDSLSTGDVVVTLYDTDNVNMVVTVAEEDMTEVSVGMAANIALTAYSDTVFEGAVSEISDASTDRNGNVSYEVTVTVRGDVSGLFQGMTGEVTLITRQTDEVLYVSNRAIIREGTASYVKVKEKNGNIRRQRVVTGFSDGENVEIIEGLSEGDTVLIESKVSGV